jgi:D-alanyl-D-alanine carboxypeptidase
MFHFPVGTRSQTFYPFGNVLIVRGELPKPRTVLEAFAIPEPDRAAASFLGGRLQATASVPSARPDVEVTGSSVGQLAKECLVPSDNFIAENLLLMAAGHKAPLGDDPYSAAAQKMRRFLVEHVGVDPNDVRVYDGSGMSRHNLVTARAIAKLLSWVRRQSFATLWTESLASPGTGTLISRLAGSSFRGKTGSLDMVSTLSGYVRTASGREYAVSLLMNSFLVEAAAIRELQDRFVREIEAGAIDGMVFDSNWKRARSLPNPDLGAPDVGRVPRPVLDRRPSRPGAGRRTEPAYAPAHREERVAVLCR